jgi:hypothetical protein
MSTSPSTFPIWVTDPVTGPFLSSELSALHADAFGGEGAERDWRAAVERHSLVLQSLLHREHSNCDVQSAETHAPRRRAP